MKKLTCSVCQAESQEEVDALVLNLPTVADVLASVIGSTQYKLVADEAPEITYVKEFDEDEAGLFEKVKIELAEAVVYTEDTFMGHLKFEYKLYTKDLTTATTTVDETGATVKAGALYVYVNGDAVSIEVTTNGVKNTTEIDVTEMLYASYLQQYIGMPYDSFRQMAYVMQEAMTYAPKFAAMLSSIDMLEISEEYVQNLDTLFDTFKADIIQEEVDGTNTVYTLDLEAFTLFIEEIEGKTLSIYIDEVYGEGTFVSIKDYVVSLPEMQLRDIATSAIALAKNYGVDVKDLYNYIDYTAHLLYNVEIVIENEIESRYDMTFGEILLEVLDNDELTVEDLKKDLASVVDQFGAWTFDDLCAMFMNSVGGSNAVEPLPPTDEKKEESGVEQMSDGDEGTDEEIGVLETLKDAIAAVAGMTNVQVVVDETGAIVSMEASVQMGENFAGITYETTSGTEEEDFSYTGWKVTVTGTNYSYDDETDEEVASLADLLIIEYMEGVQDQGTKYTKGIIISVPQMQQQLMMGQTVPVKGVGEMLMFALCLYDPDRPESHVSPIFYAEYMAEEIEAEGEAESGMMYSAGVYIGENKYFDLEGMAYDGGMELSAIIRGYVPEVKYVENEETGEPEEQETEVWTDLLTIEYEYSSDGVEMHMVTIQIPNNQSQIMLETWLDPEVGNAMWAIGLGAIDAEPAIMFGIMKKIDEETDAIVYTGGYYAFDEQYLDAMVTLDENGVLTSVDIGITWSTETKETHYDMEDNETIVTHVTESVFMITYEEQVWTVIFTEFTDEERDGIATLTIGNGEIEISVESNINIEIVGALVENGVTLSYEVVDPGETEDDSDEVLSNAVVSLTMEEEGLVLAFDIDRFECGYMAYVTGSGSILFQVIEDTVA